MSCSRQIRPPIYSLKQSKLRKRRVIRYSIMYFAMFVLFLILIVGPIVAGQKHLLDGIVNPVSFSSSVCSACANTNQLRNLDGALGGLVQPTGLNSSNVNWSQTGTGSANYTLTHTSSGSISSATGTADASNAKMLLFARQW